MTAPGPWSPPLVRDRLVEAYRIEFRLPAGRGTAGSSSWPFPVVHAFADVVGWTDARDRVLVQWEHARGALPFEVSRMHEAFGWLDVLHPLSDERVCLASWAMLRARRKSLRPALRKYAGSRATFYRSVERGSLVIADHLNRTGVMVR